MGAVYRETYTKPLPAEAELFTRKGEQFARWRDHRGKRRTAPVAAGKNGEHRILLEAGTYTAKYRNGAGHVVKVSTGCRSLDGARAVLVDLETRAEKVKAGKWTAAEDAVLDHQATPLGGHVEDYLNCLAAKRGKGAKVRVSPRHVDNVGRCLRRVVAECKFQHLRDLNRKVLERWADRVEVAGMANRTLNTYLSAATAFGNWLVEAGRIVANPFARPPKRDEKAGQRRKRRALTEDELQRLLKVAQLRPIAEYGRNRHRRDDADQRDDKKSRRTWRRVPLEYVEIEAAVERGRQALRTRPDVVAELERRGKERAMIYKSLVLTGLRKGELASLVVGNLELTGATPYIVLNAADEKAGRGAEIPVRADLVADLQDWISHLLAEARERARVEGRAVPATLAAETPLFNVPAGLVRILDRDLVAAGIARLVTDEDGRQRIDKRDDRGRTIDVHGLRHTFGTHLSKGGVAPRTAQAAMRHGSLDLTMNTYTDPKLLDVAGALEALPNLPLDGGPGAVRQRATGTDDRTLVPTLVPTPGNRSTSESSTARIGETGSEDAGDVSVAAGEGRQMRSSAAVKRRTRFELVTTSLEGWSSTN